MRLNLTGWYVPDRLLPNEPDPAESQLVECREQLEAVLPHVPRRELVIQAGGRVGVWPRALASAFKGVLTFEPDPGNFECLLANTLKFDNVVAFEAALGPRRRYAYLTPSTLSSGEHYIAIEHANGCGMKRVAMETIDTIMRVDGRQVGAIMLDVEGYERHVLEGARETLTADKPTLVLEENRLCHRYGFHRGDLARWLKPLGYEYAGSYAKLPPEIQNDGHFRGADLIFTAR